MLFFIIPGNAHQKLKNVYIYTLDGRKMIMDRFSYLRPSVLPSQCPDFDKAAIKGENSFYIVDDR